MRYTAEDCKLSNYNCNMRSKVNWSLAAMYFQLLLTTKEIRPNLFRANALMTSNAKNVSNGRVR